MSLILLNLLKRCRVWLVQSSVIWLCLTQWVHAETTRGSQFQILYDPVQIIADELSKAIATSLNAPMLSGLHQLGFPEIYSNSFIP